ncbi:Helicase ATP-binding domain-containing protein [Lachancea thermotolerans]|uniref:DNA helicase n=1 Tax=Lachancea thermotolerans (strain ATCC 56472 / CBS 6340 / NRRL Y-8284) TaxID=559295 RepID=C5DDG3_LACTC|nr:KLTH0C00770p [Lachancea thermotolerans CBS 6340]CAR21824.1 KLTH0C00770p [Lachancea thermotolerans CBS 6340]
MNKVIGERFLECIAHEQSQDTELTARLLETLPLSQLVSKGLAINHLTLQNVRSGLAGRLYVELGPDTAIDQEIIRGDVRNGDLVVIRPSGAKKDAFSCEGVVTKCSEKCITVAVDEAQEKDALNLYSSLRLYLLKTTNTITYKRMQSTLRKLCEFDGVPQNEVIQYLLDAPVFTSQTQPLKVDFFNPDLNTSQKKAIEFSLQNRISIIHGPPGTGKTHTVVELVHQLYNKGQRVLVCGPSNIAVDTILERLAKVMPGESLLRIGHPARLLESNLSHSLEVLSKSGDAGAITKDISKEIDDTIASIKKLKSYKQRKEQWKEVRELRKELKLREKKVISDLVLSARVVVSTLHGSSARELVDCYKHTDHIFDTLIIDEVSQSLEPQCWIPLIAHYKSDIQKLVLAGDDKQLPPTIKTEDNTKVKNTLGTTLFDRLVKKYGDSFRNLLDTQYRMNSEIMEFSSIKMYDGKLKAADSVASWTLVDLPATECNENTEVPLIWYDTQAGDFPERAEDQDSGSLVSSKYNENEAFLALHHVTSLIDSNVPQECIGIISPYNAQVAFLKKTVHPQYPLVEISTVDGFQGREKEVIILSLVRSNDKFEVGFLSDQRRLNVAMTRPKKQLCVIGNMETLERSGIEYLKDWVRWSEEHSEIRYPDLSEIL